MIIRFVDVDGIVDHHCLSLFVIVEYLPVVKNLEKNMFHWGPVLNYLVYFEYSKAKLWRLMTKSLSLEVDMMEGIHINGVLRWICRKEYTLMVFWGGYARRNPH